MNPTRSSRHFKTTQNASAQTNSITLRLGIVEDATKDPRVYNRPTASEVAALIPITGGGDGARHVVLQRFGDSAKEFLNEQRQEYLTLRYPFLYPRGELGRA
ncbi:hypothetical protein K402DRAFT_397438, partial [Aulographum hederae CBS 113979]